VVDGVPSSKLAGFHLGKDTVNIVSSEFHVAKSVLFWAHCTAEDGHESSEPSYKVSMQRLVRTANAE
jgi:hypothetical protein